MAEETKEGKPLKEVVNGDKFPTKVNQPAGELKKIDEYKDPPVMVVRG